METTADRIRVLRNALELKQTPFGKKIDYSQAYVSDIENGEKPIKQRFLDAICHAFPNVNPEWLKEGRGDIFLPPKEETEEDTFRRLLKARIKSLPAPAQEMILEYCLEIQAAFKEKETDDE